MMLSLKQKNNLEEIVAVCLEDLIFTLPLVFSITNIYVKNKAIKYINMISLTLLIAFCCVILFSSIKDGSEYAIFNSLDYSVTSILIFWLWYTQIAQHIGFKEKIKFDYKPIKKKVAVTETTLEELKLMYDNGTITESEYNRRKSEIINKL